MKKIILYIAQSLDGYVASKNGGVTWLDDYNKDYGDYGYKKFIKKIDTTIQGNTTYQQFKTRYPVKNNYVFSKDVPAQFIEGVDFVKGSIKKFVANLDNKIHKNIWLVGGPSLLAGFLNVNKVDEMIIFTMPVLLKDGIPLFYNVKKVPILSLKNIKKYNNGVVTSHYLIKTK